MTTVFHRLGPYTIERELGRGGMAQVFLATDSRTGRRVALRVIRRTGTSDSEEVQLAEQLGVELQHQFSQVSAFVPAVYERHLDDEYFYVAMEYVEGEDLERLIARGPLPLDRAVAITSDLCRFIEAADNFDATLDGEKRHSLIHGDLTPSNVRVTPDGGIKIIDFGIAKALSLTRKVVRNDYGKLAYLSPERLETNEVDRYADFWAAGVMLYEMVQGARPFSAPDTRRLDAQIRSHRPPPPLDDRCPRALQAIIGKLLAPHAPDRYDTAKAIREDLDRFTSGTQTCAEQEGWPGKEVAEPVTRRTTPPSPAPSDEATRRTITAPPQGLRAPMAAASGAAATAAPSQKGSGILRTRTRRVLAVVLTIMMLGLVSNELSVAGAARRVADSVSTRELDDLGEAWNRYDDLAERSRLGMATTSLRRTLTDHTSVLAERVIANYRTPMPSVREAQWKAARQALARAVAASSNNRLRAAMRYCDGHLHRINGEARLERRQLAAASHEFAEAVAAFREAAELRSNWPDPFLGLARTFIYGLEDVDRGADALKRAERLGYAPGDRETVQLADGYRARGRTLAKSARELKGLPQERDHFSRAVEAYQQAITLYEKAAGFPGVTASLKTAQRELEQIRHSLEEPWWR